MKCDEWKTLIELQMKIDQSYMPSFQTTITILSEMLEERDRVYEQYLSEGAQPNIIFETDRGARNPKPNPLLRTWHDINTLCLSYLRDLGLTAAGLRKLQGQIPRDNGGISRLDVFREKLGIRYNADGTITAGIEEMPDEEKDIELVRSKQTSKRKTPTTTKKRTTTAKKGTKTNGSKKETREDK